VHSCFDIQDAHLREEFRGRMRGRKTGDDRSRQRDIPSTPIEHGRQGLRSMFSWLKNTWIGFRAPCPAPLACVAVACRSIG